MSSMNSNADGVFYQKDDDGWVVVPAPIGAEVSSIPDNFEIVKLEGKEVNYYGGGAHSMKKLPMAMW